MNRLFVYSIMFLCTFAAKETLAQSTTDNYVKVYKAQKPHAGDLSTINDKDEVTQSVVYYDGLGREVQSVARQGSPLGKDIITFSKYDGYGKKTVSYLPYVANQQTGAPVADPLTAQISFYQSLFGSADGHAALSQTVIEHSELSRIVEQVAPGDAWKKSSNRTVKKQYFSNTIADSVFRINYNDITGISVTPGTNAFYPDYSLSAVKTIDEEGSDVVEFVDKEGRTVCKKVKASSGVYASTYYIYDDLGNLVVVLPPEAVERITDN